MKIRLRLLACAILAALFCQPPLRANGQEASFSGKTVRIVVGFSAGGGFDAYSRAIARHFGKHIPGNPAMLVENMAGAGSLIAANHTYRQAKPDGLTIGHFIGGVILGQVMGNPGTQFDARRFEYLGAPARLEAVCALTKASGITDAKAWLGAKSPVKLGATGPGSETYDVPRVLEAALGLPMQVISGYKGTADIRIAAESGELGGLCWGWEVMKVQWKKALDGGDVMVVIQALPKAQPDLLKVAVAIDLAKSEDARQLIRVGIHDQSAMLRPYVLPPGTPKEIVRTLRKAFQDTMKDAQFVAEMNQARLGIDPLEGQELERIVAGLFKLPPAVLAKLKEVLAPKK